MSLPTRKNSHGSEEKQWYTAQISSLSDVVCNGQAHIAQEHESSRRFLTQGNHPAYNLREVELCKVSLTTTARELKHAFQTESKTTMTPHLPYTIEYLAAISFTVGEMFGGGLRLPPNP